MKLMDRFFNGGEENVLKEATEIIHIAIEANEELARIVQQKRRDIHRIHELEKASDKKVFRLSNMVSSGAVSPNIIDDVLTLIDLEDNIVDSVYNLARELARYYLPNARLRSLLQTNLLEAIELNSRALGALERMHSTDNIEKIRTFRLEIEGLEERGDEIKDSLLDYVYKHEMDYKSFVHISEVAHKTDNILDNCEDSSDMFLSIMLSIMT